MSGFDTSKVDALAAAETGELPALHRPGALVLIDIPGEVDLEGLFSSLYIAYAELADETRMITKIILNLEKQKEGLAEPYEKKIELIKGMIQKEILRREDSFKGTYGSATFKRAYERASWDDKKLQGFMLSHPEIKECRKVTVVDAQVQIKVGGK